MKLRLLSVIALLVATSNFLFCAEYKVFHTSICYDLLSSIQECKFTCDSIYFADLQNDKQFLQAVENVNSSVRASNLCNLYSSAKADKSNISACIDFFSKLTLEDIPANYRGQWIDNILRVKQDIVFVLTRLYNAGYETYWKEKVKPRLEQSIQNYKFKEGLLENIHKEINLLAGTDSLSSDYSKIYILDISNAFSLIDETFCCTYYLLDKEIAKKYSINFTQVYIHENLHRLFLSPELFKELDRLTSDKFYYTNEQKAKEHGEGKNEAFVVAAETYISHKLGLKDNEAVYKEFSEYVDGSLVLAPIVYIHLDRKRETETFNQFLIDI